MRLIRDPCREEQLVRIAIIRRTAPESQRPQTIDCHRIPFGIDELSLEASAWVERVNSSVTEIPDQYVAAEWAEISRGDRQAPGRVQRSGSGKVPDDISFCIEYVDIAVSGAGLIIVLVWELLQGERNP